MNGISNFEDFQKVYREATLDKLEQLVKDLPFFKDYVSEVEQGKKKADKLLQAITLMFATNDDELKVTIDALARNMLFDALDLRLKSQVLGGKLEN